MCGFKICLLSEWCESVSQSNTFFVSPATLRSFQLFCCWWWIDYPLSFLDQCLCTSQLQMRTFTICTRWQGNLQTETRRGGVNFWDINLINLCPWELPLQIQWFEVLLVIRLRLIADCLNSALNWLPHSLEKWMVIIKTSFTWSYQHLRTSIDE